MSGQGNDSWTVRGLSTVSGVVVGGAGRPVAPVDERGAQALAAGGDELRFGVERVHVRHAAAHVHEDDPLGLAGELRRAGSKWIDVTRVVPLRLVGQQLHERSVEILGLG